MDIKFVSKEELMKILEYGCTWEKEQLKEIVKLFGDDKYFVVFHLKCCGLSEGGSVHFALPCSVFNKEVLLKILLHVIAKQKKVIELQERHIDDLVEELNKLRKKLYIEKTLEE